MGRVRAGRRTDRRPRAGRRHGGLPGVHLRQRLARRPVREQRGPATSLGFLAAANNAPETGTGTIYYTDGTTQTFTLGVGNFWYGPGQNGNPANTQVAAVNYANYPTGSSGHTIYVFEQSVLLTAGKTVQAVTLPSLGSVTGYNPPCTSSPCRPASPPPTPRPRPPRAVGPLRPRPRSCAFSAVRTAENAQVSVGVQLGPVLV